MRIEFTNRGERDLRALGPGAERALREIDALRADPEAGETLVGDLSGARSLHFGLPQGGQYRATYVVLPAEEVCLVFLIGPRENFYRRAATRYLALKRAGRL